MISFKNKGREREGEASLAAAPVRAEGMHIDLGCDSLVMTTLCQAAPGQLFGAAEQGRQKASSSHCFRFDARVSAKFSASAKEFESWIFK